MPEVRRDRVHGLIEAGGSLGWILLDMEDEAYDRDCDHWGWPGTFEEDDDDWN